MIVLRDASFLTPNSFVKTCEVSKMYTKKTKKKHEGLRKVSIFIKTIVFGHAIYDKCVTCDNNAMVGYHQQTENKEGLKL